MAYAERVNDEKAAGVLTGFFLSTLFLCPKGDQSIFGFNSSPGEFSGEYEVGFGSKVGGIERESQQFFVSFSLIFLS